MTRTGDELHARSMAWLEDGARDDPPRDVAVHASSCPICAHAGGRPRRAGDHRSGRRGQAAVTARSAGARAIGDMEPCRGRRRRDPADGGDRCDRGQLHPWRRPAAGCPWRDRYVRCDGLADRGHVPHRHPDRIRVGDRIRLLDGRADRHEPPGRDDSAVCAPPPLRDPLATVRHPVAAVGDPTADDRRHPSPRPRRRCRRLRQRPRQRRPRARPPRPPRQTRRHQASCHHRTTVRMAWTTTATT